MGGADSCRNYKFMLRGRKKILKGDVRGVAALLCADVDGDLALVIGVEVEGQVVLIVCQFLLVRLMGGKGTT